jgi:hypothetical protein
VNHTPEELPIRNLPLWQLVWEVIFENRILHYSWPQVGHGQLGPRWNFYSLDFVPFYHLFLPLNQLLQKYKTAL